MIEVAKNSGEVVGADWQFLSWEHGWTAALPSDVGCKRSELGWLRFRKPSEVAIVCPTYVMPWGERVDL